MLSQDMYDAIHQKSYADVKRLLSEGVEPNIFFEVSEFSSVLCLVKFHTGRTHSTYYGQHSQPSCDCACIAASWGRC